MFQRDPNNFNLLPEDIRTQYYLIIDKLVHLYKLYHQSEPFAIEIDDLERAIVKIDDIEKLVETLYEQHIIDDYLNDCLKDLCDQFPTLIGEVALYDDHKITDEAEIKELKRLLALTEHISEDLTKLVIEVSEEDRVRYEKEFAKRHK